MRAYDTVCRYGGEELVVLVPSATAAAAKTVAEALRQEIERTTFHDAEHALPTITASFGVAVFPDHARTPGELLRAADQALYRAKDSGRNRVMVFGEP